MNHGPSLSPGGPDHFRPTGPKGEVCGLFCAHQPLPLWKYHRFVGISLRTVDGPQTTIQDARHAEHGDGTGTGWNRRRGGRVTARNPKGSRPWGRPGEVFGEDCSQADLERGRRVGRRHNGVKAGGAGPGREARTGSNGQDAYWARHRPGAPPPPGGRGSRSGTGNGVPGPTGRSGAVGHRKGGTVGLSPDGGSWLSQVRSAGRRVGGTGSERSPSGHRSQGRSPERVADRVAVGRRNGSEELTGSPGGYSGPLSRFSGSRGPYGT